MSDELWLAAVGWEGLYEVSDQGRVRSLDHSVEVHRSGQLIGRRTVRGRVLKPGRDKNGYLHVTLSHPSPCTRRTVQVAELVLVCHASERPPGLVVRHLDDVKSNNRVSNLEWGTQQQNVADAIRNGRRQPKGYSARPNCRHCGAAKEQASWGWVCRPCARQRAAAHKEKGKIK